LLPGAPGAPFCPSSPESPFAPSTPRNKQVLMSFNSRNTIINWNNSLFTNTYDYLSYHFKLEIYFALYKP